MAWVGLNGPAGCGKDTLAAILVDEFGWTRIAFADPVREMAYDLDPWITEPDVKVEVVDADGVNLCALARKRLSQIVDEIGWDRAKSLYPEVRRTLQRMGTEAVRKQAPEFWVDLAREKAMLAGTPVVFTDMRFPNEAAMIRSLGGTLAHIRGDIHLRGEAAEHASENALKDWDFDFTFDNPPSTPDVFMPRLETLACALAS